MKERIKKMLLRKFKISYDTTEELFSDNLLSEKGCRKYLVKHEYYDLMSRDGHIAAKIELSEKYFISTRTIDRDLYEDN